MVVLSGVAKALHRRPFYPFALLIEDLALQQDRLAKIETALEIPGAHVVRALLALKRSMQVPPSQLKPSSSCVAVTA